MIHPKTGGAAIGAAIGVLLVAIANSFHHVVIPAGVTDAFSALLPVIGAYLTPSPDSPPTPAQQPAVSAQPPKQGGEPMTPATALHQIALSQRAAHQAEPNPDRSKAAPVYRTPVSIDDPADPLIRAHQLIDQLAGEPLTSRQSEQLHELVDTLGGYGT